jgi:hypothetical protein
MACPEDRRRVPSGNAVTPMGAANASKEEADVAAPLAPPATVLMHGAQSEEGRAAINRSAASCCIGITGE